MKKFFLFFALVLMGAMLFVNASNDSVILSSHEKEILELSKEILRGQSLEMAKVSIPHDASKKDSTNNESIMEWILPIILIIVLVIVSCLRLVYQLKNNKDYYIKKKT